MKKLLSFLLAFAMLVALAQPVFAEEESAQQQLYAEAYDMTYYVGGYGTNSSRYQCQIRYEDSGWAEWYDIAFGDDHLPEWPTEAGTYNLSFEKTVVVEGTEYIFTVPINIHVLELPATSGQCGEAMNWSFDVETDTLTISGTGDMYTVAESVDDFWNEVYGYEPGWWRLPVKHIIVEEGVENLSNFAFFQGWNRYYEIHETIQLPATLKAIPELGFIAAQAITELKIPEGITSLTGWPFGSPGNSFTTLTDLYLPSTLAQMDIITIILSGIDSENAEQTLQTIHYAGTQEQWDAIERVRSETMASIMPIDDETYALYEERFNSLTVVFEPREEVKEDITIENGTATVPDSFVEIKDGEDVIIDVADTEDEVSSIVIGAETVGKITNSASNVAIKLPSATIRFDTAAMGAIGQQAGTGTVTIVAKKTDNTTLTDEQKAALAEKEVLVILALEANSGDTKISEFGSGKVTISVPFELPEGKTGADFYVAYIAKDGTITNMPTSYADGILSFETTHFSDYVIMEKSAETPPEGGETPPEGGETPPEGGETPPEGGETPPTGEENDENTDNPPTGDRLLLLTMLMLTAATGLIVCLTKRRCF